MGVLQNERTAHDSPLVRLLKSFPRRLTRHYVAEARLARRESRRPINVDARLKHSGMTGLNATAPSQPRCPSRSPAPRPTSMRPCRPPAPDWVDRRRRRRCVARPAARSCPHPARARSGLASPPPTNSACRRTPRSGRPHPIAQLANRTVGVGAAILVGHRYQRDASVSGFLPGSCRCTCSTPTDG